MHKPIYTPGGKAKEYGELCVNIYSGCPHRCDYCYVPDFLHIDREQFHSNYAPRRDIVASVKRQIKRESITGKTIHLCFTCDPYPLGVDTTPTTEVIQAIKESGNHVQILTKGGMRAERDFDLLDENDWFGVSITGGTPEMQEHEPNAASFASRLLSLAAAHQCGIKTWVSCEPALEPLTIYNIIGHTNVIDRYCFGKLNYKPSKIDWGRHGRECERLCLEHGRDFLIKEDLRREMERCR